MMLRFVVVTLVLALLQTSVSAGKIRDNIAPSQNPPGSLTPAQVPQFVVLGIDDNKYQDGVEWAADYFRSRVNPKGTGNPSTYDSMPARGSFYLLALPAYNNYYLKRTLKNLYLDGNELGNHTLNHLDGNEGNFTDSLWKIEMAPCQTYLVDSLKIPSADIWGFRTPFLAYNNNGFTAMQQMGFVYDCSIEEGEDSTLDGTNYFWPYTLDGGSPGANVSAILGTHPPVDSSHDGLWEIPVYLVVAPPDSECAKYNIPTGLRKRLYDNLIALTGDTTFDTLSGKITGLDYNFWFDFNMTKADYVAILSYSLDLRLAGNRAPFIFGGHSDFYSLQYISEPVGCNTNYLQRRDAMDEFMDYALSKSDVRVVSARDVIRWMRNPVALGQAFTGPCTLTVAVIDSGSVLVNPLKDSYAKDEQVVLTATPAAGWSFDHWSGPDITGDSTTLALRMYKNITAKALFKKNEVLLDTSNPSADLVSLITWEMNCDEIGSSVLDHSTNGDSPFFCSFFQAPKPDTAWTWIEFVATKIPNIKTVVGIEAEYQCDNPVIIQLVQTDFDNDESYAHYQIVGPKTSDTGWINVKAGIKQFYQPDWTPLASKKPLNMQKVYNLGLTPSVGEGGDSTTITVRKLIMYYTPTPIINDPKVLKTQMFSVYQNNASKLVLRVPEDGRYTVRFFSINGRELVALRNITCKKGYNILQTGRQALSSGMYVVSVRNKAMKGMESKLIVNK